MIEFKASKNKLEKYVEMAVKFGEGEKGEPFTSYDEFVAAVHDPNNKIKNSQSVDYDNQEPAWRKLAEKHGYDGLKDLANTITKFMDLDSETFAGIEGLAAISGNKELMDMSDYGIVGSADNLITSMFYGGSRMKQWKRYVKPYITPSIFIDELKASDDYGQLEHYGIQDIQIVSNKVVKVFFKELNTENPAYDTDQTSPDHKGYFHQALENGDELFDFSIAEDFASNIWTITVK